MAGKAPEVCVWNSDVEVMSTLLRFVGMGSIALRGPYQRSSAIQATKDQWRWRITRRKAILDLLQQVAPWLTSKQDRAVEITHALLKDVATEKSIVASLTRARRYLE